MSCLAAKSSSHIAFLDISSNTVCNTFQHQWSLKTIFSYRLDSQILKNTSSNTPSHANKLRGILLNTWRSPESMGSSNRGWILWWWGLLLAFVCGARSEVSC
jgi:hypothetical protein